MAVFKEETSSKWTADAHSTLTQFYNY